VIICVNCSESFPSAAAIGEHVLAKHMPKRVGLTALEKELMGALEGLLPYLSDEKQLLDNAACEDGQAGAFDIASVRARSALSAAKSRAGKERTAEGIEKARELVRGIVK